MFFVNPLRIVSFGIKKAKFLGSYRHMSGTERTITVQGKTINYIKIGDGPNNVFLLPGALGTIQSDFKPQVDGLNKSKFTIYAWDPPGYGNSRPPNKSFNENFYHEDAELAALLMKELGVEKYCPLGWSDGGITALIMAAMYKYNINKLVVWGANAYVTNEDISLYEAIRNVSKWSDKMREPLVALYSLNGLQEMWSQWVDTLKGILKNKEGNICKEVLKDIRAETLIIHGDKDPLVPAFHPQYLQDNIPSARVHHFPDGKHNLHLKYAKEFNELVQNFISK